MHTITISLVLALRHTHTHNRTESHSHGARRRQSSATLIPFSPKILFDAIRLSRFACMRTLSVWPICIAKALATWGNPDVCGVLRTPVHMNEMASIPNYQVSLCLSLALAFTHTHNSGNVLIHIRTICQSMSYGHTRSAQARRSSRWLHCSLAARSHASELSIYTTHSLC